MEKYIILVDTEEKDRIKKAGLQEIARLKEKIAELEVENARLKDNIMKLEAENVKLKFPYSNTSDFYPPYSNLLDFRY